MKHMTMCSLFAQKLAVSSLAMFASLMLSIVTVLTLNAKLVAAQDTPVQNAFVCISNINSGKQTDTIIDRIETAYTNLISFQSVFNQESYFLGLDRREQSQGKVYFVKPGKMHWHYETPQEQKFISNGVMAWLYQPQLNQVTTMDFKRAFDSDMPVSFLLGISTLRDTFTVKEACNTSHGIKILLAPKIQDQTMEQMHLLVDAKNFQPLGSRVENIGGNETTILFLNQDTKAQLPSSLFEFDIPRGVDVIDQRDLTNSRITNSDTTNSRTTGSGITNGKITEHDIIVPATSH